jgi:long-chain fatty acid transport protein
VDYKWIDWSGVHALGNAPFDHGLGWRDQHIGKAALVFAATQRLTLRCGVSYGRSPVDENHLFTNALAPVFIETHLAGGLTWRVNSATDVHLSAVKLLAPDLEEQGRGDLLSAAGKGTRASLGAGSLHLGVTWRF